jgi:hypothetical protein
LTQSRLLVVGTYPPIPLPAAAASVAAVRRGWDAGYEVTAISPRLSAAHLAVPVTGPFAGRRLDHVRRLTSASRLVLVVEPGFPVPVEPRLMQLMTIETLIRALRRFDHVTVVRVGPTGVPARVERRLLAEANEVLDHPDGGSTLSGVTPLGPIETKPSERPRQLAGAAARLILGSRARAVRSRLGQIRRAVGLG